LQRPQYFVILVHKYQQGPTMQAPCTRIDSFHLVARRAEVLPLFTARGERAWVPGWNPEILSGSEDAGSAFRTHNTHGQETLWVVTDYRPQEGRVSYARATLGSNIGLVEVTCTEPPAGGTDVSVRYTLTPLSEAGREFIQSFLSEERYSSMIDEWRRATSAALASAAASETSVTAPQSA
jgi:hypothetical protein